MNASTPLPTVPATYNLLPRVNAISVTNGTEIRLLICEAKFRGGPIECQVVDINPAAHADGAYRPKLNNRVPAEAALDALITLLQTLSGQQFAPVDCHRHNVVLYERDDLRAEWNSMKVVIAVGAQPSAS